MRQGNSRGAKTITHEYKISKQYITVQISLQIEKLKNRSHFLIIMYLVTLFLLNTPCRIVTLTFIEIPNWVVN